MVWRGLKGKRSEVVGDNTFMYSPHPGPLPGGEGARQALTPELAGALERVDESHDEVAGGKAGGEGADAVHSALDGNAFTEHHGVVAVVGHCA